MSDTQNVVNGFTSEQLAAMLKASREADKAVERAIAARLAHTGLPMLEQIVEESTLTYSTSSGWVGTSAQGLPFEVDGVSFTASVTITHTAETERRKPLFAAIKKLADEVTVEHSSGVMVKLSASDKKTWIAEALKATETAPVSA